MSGHFDRPIMIDISKDGTISFRPRTTAPLVGAVPVFSTDTFDEARGLRIYLCTEQDHPHPTMMGERWFLFDDFSGDVEELPIVTMMFDEAYTVLYSKSSLAA